MSQDIRRFLQVKTSPAPVKKRRIEDDDDDVIPESPDVQIKTKKKKTAESKLSSKNKSPKPALKEVKVTDLFGNGPIKRTEPVVKKVEPKAVKNTETGIHLDEEFEKCLLEIDDSVDVVCHEDKLVSLPEVSASKGESHKKQKHSLSMPKHKSEHKNENKTTTDSKSPVKDEKQKHSEIKKNVDAKKKEIRDTNKRKFEVFLEDDVDTEDINKKTKIDDSVQSTTKSDDSHKSRSTSDDSHNIKNKSDDDHKSLNKSGKSHKSENDDDFHKSKSTTDPSKSKDKSDDSHKSKNKSNDFQKSKSTTIDSLKSKNQSDTLKSKSKSDDSMKNKSKSDVSHKSTSKSKSDDAYKAKMNGDAEKCKTNNVSAKTETYDLTADDSMMSEADQPVHKKRNISLNESVLTDEERHERKIHSAQLYQKYLNRTGPKHLGTKEMPEGAHNCLKDCAFLLTGVLDSFEREEIEETIKKYGGSIKSGISKKVTHVLAGEDAGPAKMAKAADLGIRIIDEDGFLKMLVDSHKNNAKSEPHRDKKDKKSDHEKTSDRDKKSRTNKLTFEKSVKDEVKKSEIKKNDDKKTDVKKKKSDNHENMQIKLEVNGNHDENNIAKISGVVKLEDLNSESGSSASSVQQSSENVKTDYSGMMWVEKYKPQTLKQIIGQHGEASNVNKLSNWLKKWYVNRKAKLAKPSPWAKNDDGGFYKAALLSGPPGVGKTTTVALVCKELGFDTVEFNASDTRNKTLIKEQIGELLTTTSLSAYAKGDTGKQAVTKKHALVMDEVDGMAGNEDRGGLQELIGLIKTTSVPIICMCNDRNSQKMRSLVNYCYDLRFSRPRVDQIKSAMRSICCKENIKIPPDVLGQLIVSANQDVRQTLNLLSMWAVDPTRMDADKLSKDASVPKKDVKLGPWEAIRKVFSAEEHKKMSINDKSDLFFYDYSLSPLFVQENYLQVQPHCPKNEVLDRISKAAESIAIGDTIDKRIRSAQAWNLLPMQAMYSSVIPGHHMSGHVTGQIQFPGWLGKNSRANKMHRLCQEIHAHTRLSTTGSKSSIFLDYAPHLRDAILAPLITERSEGIERSLQVLESYHLLREDLESLSELAQWPGAKNPAVLVDPKVKAAMTRTYNKKASALPYAPGAIKRGKARDDDDVDDNDDDNDDDAADSDPENDALIKKKKSKEYEKPSSSDKPSTSKGKSNAGKGKKKK